MDDIFVTTLVTEKIKIKPTHIGKSIPRLLLAALRMRFEGKCSHHGYIKPGSIRIVKHSMGHIVAVSLNGDIQYTVQFHADVCNPAPGSVVRATVSKINKFGILAECGMLIDDKYIALLDIIVAKYMIDQDNIDVTNIKQGDPLNIQILGQKFELDDKKISVIGKIVMGSAPVHSASTDSADNTGILAAEDDDEVEVVDADGDGEDDAAEEESSEVAESEEDEDDDADAEDDPAEEEGAGDDGDFAAEDEDSEFFDSGSEGGSASDVD